MATDPLGPIVAVVAAQGVAAAVISSASPFSLHLAEYGAATLFSLIGIVARHAWDSSKSRTFDFKGFAFDLPTAPMMGITAYIFAMWLQITDTIVPGIIVGLGFLGPEWLRSLGDGVKTLVLNRLGGNKGG